MCIETGDSSNIAILHDNIGLILSSQGKYDEALKHSWTANKLYKQLNNTINYYWNFAYLGDIYLNLGDYEKAERYLIFGLKGSKKYGHTFGIVENSLTLGRLYFINKKFEKALSVLSSIEQKVISMKNYEYLSSIYKILSSISNINGDYKKAYEYHVKYSDYSDSVFTSEVQKKIKEVELRYKIDKKESELALLKKSKRLDELELKKANITRNYLVVIFIIASAFLVIFIYIKMRSIKNLEEKQNIINKQKEMLETINKDLIASQTHMQNLNRHLEDKVNEEVKKRENQQILLMQKSKLESLGIFSAGVAHEINQPLTSLSFSIENMMYKKKSGSLSDNYLKDKFINIAEDIKRITNIITHIRIFAREQSNFKLEKFDINEVVNNSLLIINTQLQSKDINIDLQLSPLPLLVLGNKYRLEQVLLNLILNSRYAVEKKEQLAESFDFRKKIEIKTFSDNTECYLSVQDNGIGIAKDKITNVFEPFFTTKEPEDGTGLGLSIAYGIVKEHNGDISVESEENVYTRFTIKLPSINLD
jgi:C4-dicarboxylate-specific signal transduction histidine kinase